MQSISYNPAGADPQHQFDVAVVIPTVLRPKLIRAAQSVFAQEGVSSVQLLIGADKYDAETTVFDAIRSLCPPHCTLTIIDLGYSTAARHGGVHTAFDGGALRTLLTFAANSRFVAYLDDDNRFAPNHLASLLESIDGKEWAYSLRWYVNPYTEQPICIDEWESVGPGKGIFADQRGGFVDPSCLMIDKLACLSILHRWSSLHPDFYDPDRNFFEGLVDRPHGATELATTYYSLSPTDPRAERQFQHLHDLTGEMPSNTAPPLISRPVQSRFTGPEKVFCIGLPRTGVGSLGEALRTLGLAVANSPDDEASIEAHQAAVGGNIADTFEQLDQRYPGSLFIMTVRKHGDWLNSCSLFRQTNEKDLSAAARVTGFQKRLYGGARFEGKVVSRTYTQHLERVYTYFANRPLDLLFLDICGGGDSWAPLGAFLGLSVPEQPFPHSNRLSPRMETSPFTQLINIPMPSGDDN